MERDSISDVSPIDDTQWTNDVVAIVLKVT